MLYSKARATTLTGYKITAPFSEKKIHCSQVSNSNKNRLNHESFYQSNIERLLHLIPADCKNELKRLNVPVGHIWKFDLEEHEMRGFRVEFNFSKFWKGACHAQFSHDNLKHNKRNSEQPNLQLRENDRKTAGNCFSHIPR